jgi:hypothetical protein
MVQSFQKHKELEIFMKEPWVWEEGGGDERRYKEHH